MKESIATQKAPKAIGPYSQAISDGRYLFVSGQLPIDPATSRLIEGDISVQTKLVLSNLEAILEAAGLGREDVVRVDIFLSSLNDFASMNREYAHFFNSSSPPARQTIEVSRLPLDAKIEISCIASSSKS